MGDIVRMTTTSKYRDYTFNAQAAKFLANQIRQYWLMRGKDYKVWVEKEKYGDDGFVFSIRSDIPVSWGFTSKEKKNG